MRRLAYKQLASESLYDDDEVETYSYADLSTSLPDLPQRPPEMEPLDLFFRVPLHAPRIGSERLFGAQIDFVLRREQAIYRIRSMAEDFQPP
jgi:hemin uptake protein HemP